MTPAQRQRTASIVAAGAAGLIIGPVFATLGFGFEPFRIVKAMIIGAMITAGGAALELLLFEPKLKRLSFTIVVLIRSLSHIALITVSVGAVVVIHESWVNRTDPFTTIGGEYFGEFLRTDFVGTFLFASAASFLVNFSIQISRLLGRGMLANYITGKYHTPREEERIFMFVDLKSSTTIAEGVETMAFHQLLNDYFFDINDPIVESKGEIYQYVGDEVMITWTRERGLKDANCLKCFFRIREQIELRREKYLRKYGFMPEFKAGLHLGKVIVGEIGVSKRDIVFHGDVINTASRIQNMCNTLGKQFLVSHDVIRRIDTDGRFAVEPLGKIRLKGKRINVELYSVEPAGAGPASAPTSPSTSG